MKTIFITVFEGIEIRTVLRTSIFEKLDLRIVAFTKNKEKAEFYQKEFPHIKWEVVDWRVQGLDKFFQKLKFLLLKTNSTDLHRRIKLRGDAKLFSYFFFYILNFCLARTPIRRIARFLDYHLVRTDIYSDYFKKYDPDLVFVSLPFEEIQIHMLREARRAGIKSIGFISSWDKVTSKCILRVLPDRLICFNDFVKENLIKHNEIKEKNIFVSGIPHYDYYFPVSDKQEKFNEAFRSIVYAPMGKQYSNSDWKVIDLLYKMKDEGKLGGAELLIRFQPVDEVDENEIRKRPHMIYQHPGQRFSSSPWDWDMNSTDLNILKHTLSSMDLLICYASSISIDAIIFDKPVININFELEENLEKPATLYYQLSHYKKALSFNAITLANNPFELEAAIKRYLEYPELHAPERKQLAEYQCKFLDGKSGERVRSFILDMLSIIHSPFLLSML